MAATPRRRITGWLRSATTLAAVASAAALGLAAPAHAATPNPMAHPDRDYMGSTVAAHEHVAITPNIVPSGLPGLDVSHYQGTINWTTVHNQGAKFAYIKATEGTDRIDQRFADYWRGASTAGIAHAPYHFYYFCSTPDDQADWFIRNVPKSAALLPPVLDAEWNPASPTCRKRPAPDVVRADLQRFLDRIEKHYGKRPIIYTAPDFYRDNLKGAFPNHAFWLRSVAAHPSKTYPGRKWVFWQYSGSGLSHGVRGRIDLNVFQGSEAEWRRWVGGAQLMADAR